MRNKKNAITICSLNTSQTYPTRLYSLSSIRGMLSISLTSTRRKIKKRFRSLKRWNWRTILKQWLHGSSGTSVADSPLATDWIMELTSWLWTNGVFIFSSTFARPCPILLPLRFTEWNNGLIWKVSAASWEYYEVMTRSYRKGTIYFTLTFIDDFDLLRCGSLFQSPYFQQNTIWVP